MCICGVDGEGRHGTRLNDCGRDDHYWAPPAQNRTCGIPASGSHLGCLTAKRWLDQAVVRTRSSPGDTLARLGVRHVLVCPVFSSAPPLRSTRSGSGRPSPFAGFPATMKGSDFSSPCITGWLSTFPMRARLYWPWPEARSPGSRARSLHTCWGLRPRRAGQPLALARPSVLPSAQCTVSASRGCCFRGSIPSLCAPLSTLRQSPHGHQRMTRGQCGSLDLHWQRLALFTPCRSPGARIVKLTRAGRCPSILPSLMEAG
jgi:hypothetical protein